MIDLESQLSFSTPQSHLFSFFKMMKFSGHCSSQPAKQKKITGIVSLQNTFQSSSILGSDCNGEGNRDEVGPQTHSFTFTVSLASLKLFLISYSLESSYLFKDRKNLIFKYSFVSIFKLISQEFDAFDLQFPLLPLPLGQDLPEVQWPKWRRGDKVKWNEV